jgi:hypothetical protein
VPPPMVNHAGKLHLLEAWEEKWKQCDAKKPTGNGSGSRGGGRRDGHSSRGRGNGGGRDSNDLSSNWPAKLGKDQCKHSFKFGHWGRECKNKPKKEAANLAQEAEEALMGMRVMFSSPLPAPVSSEGGGNVVGDWIQTPIGTLGEAIELRCQPVHLHQEKVLVHLGVEREERESKVWICDTRAMNHMSGSRAAFMDLDTTVYGTVWFGNDSVAQVE